MVIDCIFYNLDENKCDHWDIRGDKCVKNIKCRCYESLDDDDDIIEPMESAAASVRIEPPRTKTPPAPPEPPPKRIIKEDPDLSFFARWWKKIFG